MYRNMHAGLTSVKKNANLYLDDSCYGDAADLCDQSLETGTVSLRGMIISPDGIFLVPVLANARRACAPSIAASNARIVSRGRSSRCRVGFDRSGSTASALKCEVS